MVASPVARCPPRATSCACLETKTQHPPSALWVCSLRASRPPPATASLEKSRATAARRCARRRCAAD
eukprot:1784101-Prymnesium_polylepis.1